MHQSFEQPIEDIVMKLADNCLVEFRHLSYRLE